MSQVQGPSHLQRGKLEASLDSWRPCLKRVKNFNTTKFTMTSPPEIPIEIADKNVNNERRETAKFKL